MDILSQYVGKIRHLLGQLSDLEEEYKGRFKSSIYLTKRTQYKNALEDYKRKLQRLGRESTILVVKFDLAVEHTGGVHIYKRYRTWFVGLNEEMAKQLIIMENPGASGFEFKIIQPGILKEI